MKKISYKKILFIGLLAAIFMLVPFGFTHAQDTATAVGNILGNSVIQFVSWALTEILYIVGYFFHLALYYGGLFLNWVLELNSNIVDNPAVQIGWPITRDIANLAFVFLIIVIAFETILRTGGLQVKQALPKLIIAALLINFSLLIATVLLDFAGIFTNFFLGSAYSPSGNGGISQAIASSMSLFSFLQAPSFAANSTLTQFSAATVQFLSGLIFADIMTAIGAITMLGLAAMFLIRYVVIGILLITLPAAIIGWVVGGGGWKTWTDKFFKQAFFGPIAAFFIYIALKSQSAIEGIVQSSSIVKSVADTTDPSNIVMKNIGPNIGSMIMVVAILLYGIKKAEEGSEYTGKWTTNAATGAINGILKGTASTFISGTPLGLLGKKVGEFGEKYKSSKSGFVRGITRPLRQVGTTTKEFKENYGGITGIYTATSEGIMGGMGFGGGKKLRLKEEKAFEKKQKETKESAEKKDKRIKKESEMAENEKQMTELQKQILEVQANINQAKIGFKPAGNEAVITELETKKIELDAKLEALKKKKVEIKVDIENMKGEDIEKLKKEVKGIQEKQEEEGEKKKEKKEESAPKNENLPPIK